MRIGARDSVWIRVALSLIICIAVVTSPLRPPATHQASSTFLRRNFTLTRYGAWVLMSHASNSGVECSFANSLRASSRSLTTRRNVSAWPHHRPAFTTRRQGRLGNGPHHASFPLQC